VRQFVGLASYFRKFVPNFTTIIELLTRLTKKNEPCETQDRAFITIKQKLMDLLILMIFDLDPTELSTQAQSA